jgi:transcription initiation factor TFIIE subunit alpha
MVKEPDILQFKLTQEFLKGVGGPDAVSVVRICLDKNGKCLDEDIETKIKHLKITEIRSILNRLHYRGIACYNKAKNKNSGWYTYTWEIKQKRIVELILEQQSETLQKLEQKAQFESTHDIFVCKKNCEETPFEIAAQYEFRCPECGEMMNPADGQKKQKDVQQQITSIKTELGEMQKIL